jgi:esterase/lipase
MLILKNIHIKQKNGRDIDVDTYFIDTDRTKNNDRLMIFAHGFKGFKNWGGFPYMLSRIAEKGYFTAGFNFTYNGVEESNPMEFTRLDLFSENTISKELADLNSVIDYFYTNSDTFNISKEKIVLIGHSRGGGVSIIQSSEDKRIKSIITLASISGFDRYSAEHKRKWKEKGFFEVLNSRTNQMMRLNSTLLEDIEMNRDRFDISKSVSKINIPFLIIHGREDQSVKFTEAEEIYKHSNKETTKIFPVEHTGHTFGIVHPFSGTTRAFEAVIEKIISFLDKN